MKQFFIMLLFVGILFVIPASADTIAWKGVTWDNSYFSPSLSISGDNLIVTPSSASTNYGGAHYNTLSSFRSASTPWVEVSFIDNNMSGQFQLWMEDEDTTTPNDAGAWTQFGAWATRSNYMIYWWDYDTDMEDGTFRDSGTGWIDTGVARTEGEHTLKLAMQNNGTIDYLLDGKTVYSGNVITPDYFGDIYLVSRYAPGTFTDYKSGTDYVPAPEPTSLFLLSFGLSAIGIFNRFRR